MPAFYFALRPILSSKMSDIEVARQDAVYQQARTVGCASGQSLSRNKQRYSDIFARCACGA
jgi:hypothetical protein